jgi:MFS family permease
MSSTPDAAVSPRAAFQYKDFRLFQLARLCSIVSTEMTAVAVAWQIYEITRKPIFLGYVGLAQFMPGVLLSLIAGHAADRFDRRRILMACFCGYALCAGLFLAYGFSHTTSVLPIFGVLILFGTFRAFSGPASQSILPQLVPDEHFTNAVTWGASIFQFATILGPALGGLIYGWASGANPVYATSVVMYFCAFIFVAGMRVRTGRMEKRDISMGTLVAGFRYVWEKKVVLGSISLDLVAVLLGGAVALLPVYADQILHVGPWGLGLLRSAPAVGATLMAIVVAYKPLRRNTGAAMMWCVAVFGVFTIIFGLSRNFTVSLIALLIMGSSDMISIIVRNTLVQIATPAAMRGRVSAVNLLFIGASNELGQFESGLTAQWFGTVPAVVIGGIGTIVVVALWTGLFPELRRVDRLDSFSATS